MYLIINGARHTVSRRIARDGTIKYLSVTPPVDVGALTGAVSMYRDDGFFLSADDAGGFARKIMTGTLLELTNAPEPAPAPEPTDEELAARARAQRDAMLAACDWTQVLDAPIDSATREAYRAYRQALRDVTGQEGFPRTIYWPRRPEITKAAPDPVDEAVDVLLGGEDNA